VNKHKRRIGVGLGASRKEGQIKRGTGTGTLQRTLTLGTSLQHRVKKTKKVVAGASRMSIQVRKERPPQ